MFYGRFKNDICLPNTHQDVCMLKDITYLHEMSLNPYRPRFLQLSMTKTFIGRSPPKINFYLCFKL